MLALATTAARVQANNANAGAVAINTDFPGGNAKVTFHEGDVVGVAPDLRGDNPWFYWCFEATAERRRRVFFVLPEEVAGFTNGAIGFQGPAISGKTWTWMVSTNVRGNAFFYDFTDPKEQVRFAVTIPYVKTDNGDYSIYPEVQAVKELAKVIDFGTEDIRSTRARCGAQSPRLPLHLPSG
jgi:hypothetical protein